MTKVFIKYGQILFVVFMFSIASTAQQRLPPLTIGYVEYKNADFNKLIAQNAKIEIIGSGFQHIEGPVWVADSNMLLFSDTKAGIIYRWKQDSGVSTFLKNTGFSGRMPYSEESGSNGLAVDDKGNLIICNHGDRRISSYPLNGKYGQRTVADNFEGKRFNSPNDVLVKHDGSIWFSDPPYGLPKKEKDSTREININGVYKKMPGKNASLVIGDLSFPNGLSFSANEQLMYVSISDSLNSKIMVYNMSKDGTPQKGKVFFDATYLPHDRPEEATDGLKTDKQGNLWATGPSGVLVLNSAGTLLGIIHTGEIISNCAWGNNGYLYMTAGLFLYRIKTEMRN